MYLYTVSISITVLLKLLKKQQQYINVVKKIRSLAFMYLTELHLLT